MFIINIEDIDKSLLYECDYQESYDLQVNGFSLLGRSKDKYYFYKTQDLIQYLNLKGGENIEQRIEIFSGQH